ncbi:MAG TPA: hypothetical protein VF486_14735 [Actinomycetes bacterium]
MQHEPTTSTGDQVPVYDRSDSGTRWRDRLLAGAVCLVVGLGGGFAIGRGTAPSGPKTLAEAFQQAQQGKLPRGNLQGPGGGFPQGGGQNGQNGQNGQAGGFGGRGGPTLQGDITAINGGVLTVTTGAGELKVQLNGSTQIRKAVSANQGDLGVGDTIAVRFNPTGSNSSAGTVVASSITLEPAQ